MGARMIWLVAAMLVAVPARGDSDDESESRTQCTTLKRIFSYDKHLRESDKIVVLVVGHGSDSSDAEAIATACREIGLYPAAVDVSNLNDDLIATLGPKSTVVYIANGADNEAVSAFAARKGFLTVSGSQVLAESGVVSVSVRTGGGKPKITVNMPRLEAEGHELSSELLKLARVLR